MTSNEGRCCDAVLRVIEELHDATRTDVERDTSATRGVEVVCRIGGQRYALEHTLIEPFPENQRDDIAFERVFDDGFESTVSDLLLPELAYNVWVRVYAFEGMGVKRLESVRGQLIAWLRESIPRLKPPSDFRQTWMDGGPPAVPVQVRLACHRSADLGGRLRPGRFEPIELEQLRRERLRSALQDKSPKLHAARLPGTRTVLVLENRDIALTNEVTVSEAIDELARDSRTWQMTSTLWM